MEEKLNSKSPDRELEFCVSDKEAGKRLDIFLSKNLFSISRSMIKKLIKNNMILVNNTPKFPHYTIKKGEIIKVIIPEPEKNVIEPVEMDLDIIYEDEDLLVINKPPGLPVHPAAGHKNDTLVNALLAYMNKSGNLSTIGGVERPGIVHRLDKDTSGVLLIAKNDHTHLNLSQQFQNREVNKLYEAIVKGTIKKDKGKIEKSIVRHPVNRKKFITSETGRESLTYYEVIDRKDESTWVRLIPKTGRTHQLRVHCVSIGHPIIGDPIYSRKADRYKSLALVAKRITITHPRLGKRMTFIAAYPEHFIKIATDFGYVIQESNNYNHYFTENN